jgi:hypothetical protein
MRSHVAPIFFQLLEVRIATPAAAAASATRHRRVRTRWTSRARMWDVVLALG